MFIPHQGNGETPYILRSASAVIGYSFYADDPGLIPPDLSDVSYELDTDAAIPEWGWWNFDIDDVGSSRMSAQAAMMEGNDPDLERFLLRNNGKLLMYHGWSDSALTALGTVNYYEQVLAQDQQAMDFTRLFMMPGVLHCRNGKGPSLVNFLDELDQWVESGDAPDQITAYFMDAERKPSGSRILCPYPQKAEYDGHGDPQKGSSFSCSE